jgi:hypothetical protein
MNTPIQLKINLSTQLQELLASKAGKFGVPLTQYVKHVLMKDVQDLEYPVFKASEETEKAVKEALQQLDKSVNAKSFFKQQRNDS